MPRFAIRSSRVVTPLSVEPASVHVRDGVIERISSFDDLGDVGHVVDCGDDVIMPGIVDSHVHVNEPGRTEWEGFESATRAAAAGGVTTIVDMPLNSIPPTTSVRHLEEKIAALEGKCHVDVGLWGGSIPGNSGELRSMLAAGALGFKCFLVDSAVEEFPHVDAAELEAAMKALRGTGAPLLVHAELAGPIESATPAGTPVSYRHYLESRPAAAEVEAIELVARICGITGARAHIVHLSAAQGLEVIRKARTSGALISAETTPHYLHLHSASIPDGATEYKCAPPIRGAANRERIWAGLAEGIIAMIVSDHSPCAPELKQQERGDFAAAWGGISSVQFLLPVVWTEARERGHELMALSRWLSAAPSELAGLDDRKGRLATGLDADLVVWSPEETFTVTADAIHHRHKLTPYLGETLHGVVKQTWVRGVRVHADGTFGPPSGRWLRGRKNGDGRLHSPLPV